MTEQIEITRQRDSVAEKICKICHSECGDDAPYVYPCKCKGTLKYVHLDCLNEWITITDTKKCNICNYTFKFEKNFKEDTPKSLPPRYILIFLLKTVKNALVNLFCFLISAFKFLLIFFFNILVCNNCIYRFSGYYTSFLMFFSFNLLNILHSQFIRMAYKRITSYRVRMQSSAVLQSLLNDVATRSGSETAESTQIQQEENSLSNTSDEQVLVSLNLNSEYNIQEILFRRPSWSNLIEDLNTIAMNCCFSVCYLIIYLFNKLIVKIAPKSTRYLIKSRFFDFLDQLSLTGFFLGTFSTLLVFSFSLMILYQLKTRTSIQLARTLFYLTKCYFILVLSNFFVSIFIGSFSHFLFSLSFNNGTPLLVFKNTIVSILVHFILINMFMGSVKEVKKRLMKKFRAGLIMKLLKDDSFSNLFEYSYSLSFKEFLFRTILSSCIISAIPFLIFRLATFKMDFKFIESPSSFYFLYFKSFFLLYRYSNTILGFIVSIFDKIVKVLAKIFDAENYVYNKKIEIKDRSRLFWGVNMRYVDRKYEILLNKINCLLKAREAENKNARNSPRSTVAEETARIRSSLEQPQDSEEFVETSSNHEENNMIEKTKLSSTLIDTITKQEESQILEKYKINQRRIEKYYGKVHNRKISIFYKPRFYGVFNILSHLLCFFSLSLLISIVFRFSYFIISFKSPNAVYAPLFIYVSCFNILLISQITNFFKRLFLQNMKSIRNSIILVVYTNFIFPFIAAIGLVFMNASRNVFTYFTSLFIMFNSFSILVTLFFEHFFLYSSIGTHATIYILKQLFSFFSLKVITFVYFIAYTKIITFTSLYIPLFFTVILAVQAFKIIRVILSGSFLEKVKEHFFLDSKTVINYEQEEKPN